MQNERGLSSKEEEDMRQSVVKRGRKIGTAPGRTIPQLYPKQHKMEIPYTADSLSLGPDGQLHDNCAPSIGMVHPLRV